VPILHGRIGLGPGLAGLAQFQRRLVGQADRPVVAEKHEVLEGRGVERQRLGQCPLRVGDPRPEVVAEAGPEQRQRGGREARLDDRGFVGRLEQDGAPGGRDDG